MGGWFARSGNSLRDNVKTAIVGEMIVIQMEATDNQGVKRSEPVISYSYVSAR